MITIKQESKELIHHLVSAAAQQKKNILNLPKNLLTMNIRWL